MLPTRIFDEFNELRRSFDRFFEDFGWGSPRITPANDTDWVFAPAVETGWTNDYLNLRFVLPAVTEKDLDVSVQGNQLIVRGERQAPAHFGDEARAYHRLPYGKFERAVDLPNGLDVEKLEAHLHDGVLDVRIPIQTAMKPKKIQIAVGKEPKTIAA